MTHIQELLPLSTDFTLWQNNEGISYVFIWGKQGQGHGRFATAYAEAIGDDPQFAKDVAEFIVTACNGHEDLVAALQKWQEWADLNEAIPAISQYPYARGHAALKKAGVS